MQFSIIVLVFNFKKQTRSKLREANSHPEPGSGCYNEFIETVTNIPRASV